MPLQLYRTVITVYMMATVLFHLYKQNVSSWLHAASLYHSELYSVYGVGVLVSPRTVLADLQHCDEIT